MARPFSGLGDFNKLNLESSESLNDADKQRDFFNSTMADICGNASTSGADYFKGLSQVHDIDEALNELMTKIDANVGEGAAEKLSIDVDRFTEGAGGYSWNQLKDGHHNPVRRQHPRGRVGGLLPLHRL